MSPDSTTTKVCTKCGIEKPATTEYFHKTKSGKLGLTAACKVCQAEHSRLYRVANHEKILERNRRYKIENPEKVKESGKRYYAANKNEILRKNKERIKANPEKHAKLLRRWSQEHPEKRREYVRNYRLRHPERRVEHERRYAKANPEKMRIKWSRRTARKRNLPDTFTPKQWERALDYFHGCCAVCGSQLYDLFGSVEPHADHWIPLSNPKCTGTVVTNMLPLCNTCNLSKLATLPNEWLGQKFGKRKAKQILEKVEAYFVWAKSFIDPT